MRNPILTLLAFAAASLLVSACQVQVTPDGPPYKLAVVSRRIIITNVSSGGNNREFLWASSQKNEADSTYCARWVSGQGLAQNGVAFRIRSDSGGWDAAVLERNIYLREFWVSVVIYFHSGRNFGTALEVGPAVDLGAYLGRSMAAAVYPLRICAQLTGTTLRFAVAKGADPMPPLGTSGRGATFALNRSQIPASGATGTYIAHLPRGTSAVVDDVSIDGIPAAPPNTQAIRSRLLNFSGSFAAGLSYSR